MSEILYIQTEKNVEVHRPEICLGDVAKLVCADQKVLDRNSVRRVLTVPEHAPGRYVVSATDLIRAVAKEEPSVEVTHIGEPEFIVTYEEEEKQAVWFHWLKTFFVCLLTFFGGAFSIMTFNLDVDTSGLFYQIYKQLTGEISTGHTILEWTYSIGVGIGVLFFFNHFGHESITTDPTPMEVQMRVYEDDVNQTLIAAKNRGKEGRKGTGT